MSQAPLTIRVIAVATGVALLAACATPPPPPPPSPPPPPPVVEAVPYRPLPPSLAPYRMAIPRKGVDGQRTTINSDLNTNEAIWHFRSGWNVAALNCTRAGEEPVTAAYGAMLRAESRTLSRANDVLEDEFRDLAATQRREAGLGRNRTQERRDAIRLREAHSTAVYNYFSSPPARRAFCRSALQIANTYLATPPEDFAQFAVAGVAQYEAAFETFFTAYETYERNSAAWDAKHGAQYGPSQPGWMALYGDSLVAVDAPVPEAVGEVVDPVTGAAIPVVPVDEDASSTPVVQPIPTDGDAAAQ